MSDQTDDPGASGWAAPPPPPPPAETPPTAPFPPAASPLPPPADEVPPPPAGPYGAGQPGPFPPGAGYQQQGYGYAPVQQKTNGLAIASLVCGIVGFVFLTILLGPLALIFGFVSRKQIARSGGAQKGRGLSTAGIILGFILIALMVVLIVAATNDESLLTR